MATNKERAKLQGTLTVMSWLAAASVLPSGLNATDMTGYTGSLVSLSSRPPPLGSAPTRENYQYRYSNLGSANQQILVSSAAPGTWYILLYANAAPGATVYTLTATTAPLFVASSTPHRSGTSQDTVMTLSGTGFDNTTTVQLVAADGTTTYLANTVQFLSPTQMTATFTANTVPAGVYSVEVLKANGGPVELPDTFRMVQGGQAHLVTNVIVPNPIGYHIAATLYVQYSNSGDIAMPAPLLVLTATQNGQAGALLTLDPALRTSGFWESAIPEGYGQSVQILASGATPGWLQPGESVSVPVYYAGWLQPWDFGYDPINFTLGALTADIATGVDWTSMQSSLKPDDIPDNAWNAVYANLITQMGSTWGTYLQKLDQDASYLGSLGEKVTDVSQLWSFEIQQANGISPVNNLGSAVDMAVPAPGLPMSIGRDFSPTIIGRNLLGPFGYGWALTGGWDRALSVQSDGTVGITDATGGQRTFQPDSRPGGNYFGQPGDPGILTNQGGGVYTVTEQDGLVTQFQNGQVAYLQDTNGNRIISAFTSGLLTSLTASSGQWIHLTYNTAGRITAVTDSLGQTTQYIYDATDQYLLSVTDFVSATDIVGYTAGYSYNTASAAGTATHNALLSIANPDGNQQDFSYDAQGRLSETSVNNGTFPVQYAYGIGGTISATDVNHATTTFYFDNRGLIGKLVDPLQHTSFYSYDGNGHLAQATGPSGQTISFLNDSQGELIQSTDPLGHTTKFTYGPLASLASFTDPNGNTTKYQYDPNGNMVSTLYADGTIESNAFDPIGQIVRSTDGDGHVINYAYNANGQIRVKTYADGSQVNYVYDAQGTLTSATDANGTTTLTYDTLNRLVEVDYPGGRWLKYTYDSLGRRTQMQDQTNYTVSYSYNSLGQLTGLSDGSGPIVSYTYDAAGRLSDALKGNNTDTKYAYDKAGETLSVINYAPDHTVNSSFVYTYNSLGLRDSMTTLDGQWTYAYDATSQLTRAVFTPTPSSQVPSQDLQYFYDAGGNRTSTIINGVTTTYTTNDRNEYTHVGSNTYSYDANGNLVSQTDAVGSSNFTYDANNQLVGIQAPQSTSSYRYDVFGGLDTTTQNAQQSRYLVDPLGGSVVGQFGASGNVIAHYTSGVGLVSQVNPGGIHSFYDFDALGSTAGLTNGAGKYVNTYTYLPFGGALTAGETIANAFQFVGQWGVMKDVKGLSLMGARFYGSDLGRFTSPDPLRLLGGDVDPYTYVKNNPQTFVDPAGLCPSKFLLGVFQVGSGILSTIVAAEVLGVTGGLTGGFSYILAAEGGTSIGAGLRNIGVALGILKGDPLASGVAEGVAVTVFKGNKWAHVIGVGLDTGFGIAVTGGTKAIQYGMGQLEALQLLWSRVQYPYASALGKAFNLSSFVSYILAFNCDPFKPFKDDPNGILERLANALLVEPVASHDPNALYGPAGYGSSNFVAPGTVFPYRIDFENAATAAAPAQRVLVTEQLDPNLDWTTFRLTSLGFGDTVLDIPFNSQHYQTTVSMTYNGQTFDVDLYADLNPATGLLTVIFQALDPDTSLPPANVLTGFLPPEDGTGRGDGYVSYIINHKSNLPTGTMIRAVALITFDGNPAIATDQKNEQDPSQGIDPNKQALVTIDAVPPTSSVASLPATTASTSFDVNWSGTDDVGGSGVGFFDVFVAVDNGPFTPWLAQVPATHTVDTYAGSAGHSYAFYSVATDNVGNRETTPAAAQATITVQITVSPLSQLREQYGFYFTGDYYQTYNNLNARWFRDRTKQWYALFQDGSLKSWLLVNGQDVFTPVTQVDTAVYTDPTLLFQAPVTLAQPQLDQLNGLLYQYGFYFSGSYYQDYRGLNARWFLDRNHHWYALFTNGALKSWQLVNGQDSFMPVASVDVMVWSDPNLLLQATETLPQAALTQLTQLQQADGFHYGGSLWQNYLNLNEKWVLDNQNNWFVLTPDGQLRPWEGESDLGSTVRTIDPAVWDQPDLLFEAGLTQSVQAQLGQLRAQFGFIFTGDYYQTYNNLNAKWFLDRNNQWHALFSDGSLKSWQLVNGQDSFTLVASVAATVYTDPQLLLQAPLTLAQPALDQISGLQQTYGFHFSGNYYQDYSGQNEKWFRDLTAQWYVITPDGKIRFASYNTVTASYRLTTLIATVEKMVWDNPNLLFTT